MVMMMNMVVMVMMMMMMVCGVLMMVMMMMQVMEEPETMGHLRMTKCQGVQNVFKFLTILDDVRQYKNRSGVM